MNIAKHIYEYRFVKPEKNEPRGWGIIKIGKKINQNKICYSNQVAFFAVAYDVSIMEYGNVEDVVCSFDFFSTD